MKKLFVLSAFILSGYQAFCQSCPDCNTLTATINNATGYGCTGELILSFNGTCPTQVHVTGTDYTGAPYNSFNTVSSPSAWFLKAGSYSYQLFSFDGLTQQCSTAVIPFTITQPICDFDLQYSLGTPDYCLGSIPVNVWSGNQGCSNSVNAILYKMEIDGVTSLNHTPVTFDIPLGDSGTFTAYNYDFVNGSLQAICSESITVNTPSCGFSVSLTATAGTQCTNHKIPATKTGNACGGEWTADLFLNGNYDTTLSSTTNTIQFTGLSNGNYEVSAYTGVCFDSKLITLNYCPKPYGLSSTEITSTSAKVKWTKQTCGLGYNVQYRVMGTTTWISKTISTNTGNKILTGLQPSTNYQWKVRTKCTSSPAYYSAFTTIKTFTTLSARQEADMPGADDDISVSLQVFPNPAKDVLNIHASLDEQEGKWLMYDATGRLLCEGRVVAEDGEYQSTADISGLKQGIYLLMMKTSSGMATQRFLKQ